MRKPKDKDYIETREGFFFGVIEYLHPPNKFTSFLKYVPAEEGPWKRGTTHYRRVLPKYHVSEVVDTYEFLLEHHPKYVDFCPVRHIKLPLVSKQTIKHYYAPEKKLESLFEEEEADELEQEVLQLVSFLSDISGVKKKSFGVTGSILLNIHNPAISDIDLTVYGVETTKQLKSALYTEDDYSLIRGLSKQEQYDKAQRKAEYFGNVEDTLKIVKRKWNFGYFKGKRYFSVHPVKKNEEITETYGEKEYFKEGRIEIDARVKDASLSVFVPAIYQVHDVTVRRGKSVSNIRKVVSHEGFYSDVVREGEKIRVKGKLEEVRVENGENYYQVAIGSPDLGKDQSILLTETPSNHLEESKEEIGSTP